MTNNSLLVLGTNKYEYIGVVDTYFKAPRVFGSKERRTGGSELQWRLGGQLGHANQTTYQSLTWFIDWIDVIWRGWRMTTFNIKFRVHLCRVWHAWLTAMSGLVRNAQVPFDHLRLELLLITGEKIPSNICP
jgi:hypothetical protein